MPKVIKKRPAKKKPIQETEVKSAAMQALENLKGRQKQLITVSSIVIAAILLFAVFFIYSSQQRKKAYALEMEANTLFYGEKVDETMSEEDSLKRAVELYSESLDAKKTPTALFYLGNTYFKLGDYENAIKQYNTFVSTFSGSDEILPLAYQKLASAYFRTDQNDLGIDALHKLAGVSSGTFKDTALVLEARHYDAGGEPEKALSKYREIIEGFPDSPWTTEANAKITEKEAKPADASAGEKELKADDKPSVPEEGK